MSAGEAEPSTSSSSVERRRGPLLRKAIALVIVLAGLYALVVEPYWISMTA